MCIVLEAFDTADDVIVDGVRWCNGDSDGAGFVTAGVKASDGRVKWRVSWLRRANMKESQRENMEKERRREKKDERKVSDGGENGAFEGPAGWRRELDFHLDRSFFSSFPTPVLIRLYLSSLHFGLLSSYYLFNFFSIYLIFFFELGAGRFFLRLSPTW